MFYINSINQLYCLILSIYVLKQQEINYDVIIIAKSWW